MGRSGDERTYKLLYTVLRFLNFCVIIIFGVLFFHSIYAKIVHIWHAFVKEEVWKAVELAACDERVPLAFAAVVVVGVAVVAVVASGRRERGGRRR